ncbi:GNAT family N-acetyltransferase [Companilactobacillus paralimentarius]|uniref:GNAT family N-acetyltransferase n=1 Tax=Companilactobacillus paralimentarius TaxID=83526 RepID=UPI001D042C7F|nr:GNAT family N-acetyltransferase [Companilactobacillus paralimentarius]
MNKYLLGENEFDKFYDLYLYSFNRQDSLQRKRVFKERYDHSLAYGIMNDSKLGSGLFSIPFEVNFHGIDYKMNGIGDVMSAPEFGGQGGAGKLMNEALSDMYKNHVTLSYLAPFSLDTIVVLDLNRFLTIPKLKSRVKICLESRMPSMVMFREFLLKIFLMN